MTEHIQDDRPLVIAHATDLHPEGGVAFEHGVALARDMGARLVSMHANPSSEKATRTMPDAATLLERWAAARGDAGPYVIEHQKLINASCEDPVDSMLEELEQMHPDMLVVGTHQNTGFNRIFHSSVSGALALNANLPTLFLPLHRPGFVNRDTGEIGLRKILIPVADVAHGDRAIQYTLSVLNRMGAGKVVFFLLHIGDSSDLDGLTLPEDERWTWERIDTDAPLEPAILKSAEVLGVDLLVTATRGHDSLMDVLRGSHSEAMVRHAPCPVLSVPMSP